MIIMLAINANLKEFLKEWMTSNDPEVYRIHITHTDLDGLACSVILHEFYHNMIIKGRLPMFITRYSSAGKSNIEKNINFLFDTSGFGKSKLDFVKSRKYLVLVTDLGCVDPEIFYHYEELGFNIRFCVIDHHQDILNLADKVKDPSYTPYNIVVNPEENYSAAKLLFEYLSQCGLRYDSTHDPKQYLAGYIKAVSEYDCGHWGNSASDSVREQFIFSTYDKRISGILRYINMMTDLYKENDPDAVLESKIVRDARFNIALEDYDDSLNSMTKSIFINNDEVYTDRLMQMLHINEVDSDILLYACEPGTTINNMSIVSRVLFKHVMKLHPNAPKILIFVAVERGVIELRSSEDCEDNCAEIAAANGGGGHKHAAGFPMNDTVKSIIIRKYWRD